MNGPFPLVHAIILSYNDREALVRCIESLLASTYPRLQVVVVDNASQDDAVAEVQRRFPQCRLLVNPQNLGFGAGCNVGMAAALADQADFVLLINQDTFVAPDMVAVLVESMRKRPEIAVAGPKTYSSERMADGAPRLLYAGSWRRWLPLAQHLPGVEEADNGHYDQPLPTDYVWGHGMMLRSAVLRKVGLFDPAFFMYYEDLDLCHRIRAAGWEIWYQPRAVIWHDLHDGARASSSQTWRWDCKVASLHVFYRKYFGRLRGAVLTGLMVLVETRQLLEAKRYQAIRHLIGAYVRSCIPWRRPARPPDARASSSAKVR